MGHPGRTIRDILVWNYERGTLPYDILCGLILAFVFFVPRSCFAPKKPVVQTGMQASQSSTISDTKNSDAPVDSPQKP